MRVKTIIDEDFINYKKPSFFIGCISCGGKCAREGCFDISVCQNNEWRNSSLIDVPDTVLIERYLGNNITSAIVFGLLEPFEQFNEMLCFIKTLRTKFSCNDDVVIYTGYNEDEIQSQIEQLKPLGNIIVKFGRFRLGDEKHKDETLGVYLASDNQYAKYI